MAAFIVGAYPDSFDYEKRHQCVLEHRK